MKCHSGRRAGIPWGLKWRRNFEMQILSLVIHQPAPNNSMIDLAFLWRVCNVYIMQPVSPAATKISPLRGLVKLYRSPDHFEQKD